MRKLIFAAFVVCVPAFAGYGFQRLVAIDHTKVPNSDQLNFPVLISGTYAYLATVANGGRSQDSSGHGWDIILSSTSNCTAKLDHEMESYDPVTGTIALHVRFPVVSHSVDTLAYLCMGDGTAISSRENKSAVWDSSYKMVLHMGETSGTSLFDSTVNANNSTKFISATRPNPYPAGKIGAAQDFSSAGDEVKVVSGSGLALNGDHTYSAWVYQVATPSAGGYGALFTVDTNAGIFARSTLKLDDVYFSADHASTNSFTLNAWHYLTVSCASQTVTLYIDGVAGGTAVAYPGGIIKSIGNDNGPDIFQGRMDEIRLSSIGRSADWIATEFANQSNPTASTTFYSIGSENGIVTAAPAINMLNTPIVIGQ